MTIPSVSFVFLDLINRCPKLEAIKVPPSQLPKVSKPSRYLLGAQGVKIVERRIWGQRTDMTEYHTVDNGVILQRAAELRSLGFDSNDILTEVGIHRRR